MKAISNAIKKLFSKFLLKWKTESENKIEKIKKAKNGILLKTVGNIYKQREIMDNEINKLIEEAKKNGKEEAKKEIKKLEVENKIKIETEEKQKEDKLKDLQIEYNKKVSEIENETELKKKRLEKLVYDELLKFNQKAK